MKTRSSIIGLGQTGGKFGKLLYDKGYNVLNINASPEDLRTSKLPNKCLYHIPNTEGCDGDRDLSQEMANENAELVIRTIRDKYPFIQNVFFSASLGGGFGSGFIYMLLDNFSKAFKNVNYSGIVMLPSIYEKDKRKKINGIQAYKDLCKVSGFKNLHVLDNSKFRDYTKINGIFVEMFDRFMNLNIYNGEENVDKNEINNMLKISGRTIMAYLDDDCNILEESDIYADFIKGCEFIAITTKEPLSEELEMKLVNKFGSPNRWYKGISQDKNFIVVGGMSTDTFALNRLSRNINQENAERIYDIPRENLVDTVDIPELRTIDNRARKIKKSEDDKLSDFAKMMAKFTE